MKTKSISKLFFYLCNFVCLLVLCLAPICYAGGGASLTDSSTHLSTLAETATVERNQLGREFAEPLFADSQSEINSKNQYYDSDIATRTSLLQTYVSDILSWVDENSLVKDLNSPEDIEGAGTESEPYIVKTVRGWVWLMFKAGHVVNSVMPYLYAELGCDLDFSGYIYDVEASLESFSQSENFLVGFAGVLDGKGYKLTNIVVDSYGIFTGCGTIGYVSLKGQNLDYPETVIKNITFEGTRNSNSNDATQGFVAAYSNATFENVNFDVFSRPNVVNAVVFTVMDNGKFLNCDFNLSGSFSMAVMCAMQSGFFENPGTLLFENCASNIRVYAGIGINYVYLAQGINCVFRNCSASGSIHGEGCATYLCTVEGSTQIEVLIENCINRTTIASRNDVGGIVLWFISDSASLKVKNCINYADLYTIGKENEMQVGGIVGEVNCPNVVIEGCKNYGNLYSGTQQGGIVGLVTGDNTTAYILDCENYGNLLYPLALIESQYSQYNGKTYYYDLRSHSAGIAVSNAGSTTIQRCINGGNFIAASEEECEQNGWKYQLPDGTIYAHTKWPQAAGIMSSILYQCKSDYAKMKVISISDCKVSSTFKNTTFGFGIADNAAQAWAGMEALWGSSQADKEGFVFNVDGCKAFTSFEGRTSYTGTTDGVNVIAGKFALVSFVSSLGNVSLTNCVSEMTLKTDWTALGNGKEGMIMTAATNNMAKLSSFAIENIQSNTNITFSDNPGEDVSNAILCYGHLFGGLGAISNGMQGAPGFKNIALSANVVFSEGISFIDGEIDISQYISADNTANNILISLKASSGNESTEVKKYMNASGKPFEDGNWCYVEGVNGSVPLQKQFYYQSDINGQDDNFNQLQKLGYTEHVWAA